MRKVILKIMENMKYETIKNYADHQPKYGLKTKSKKRIAKKFQVEVKQVERWIAWYKNGGKEYFIHGNRWTNCSRAISEEKIITICKLYEDYTKWNFSNFNEKIVL
ncbi:MAG: hypothetical protein ACRC5R_02650 [Mycoplasmatales bacterium]